MDKIKELQKLIDDSDNIVFFGGAGVSTASGIKDFRSKDGLYNMQYDYPPEEILSHHFFMNNTEEFYRFYKDKMNCLDKLPNSCHLYLTELEKKGKLKAIITQNIDGLHQKAKSKNVLELHGSIYRNRCMDCNKFYDEDIVFNSNGVPRCTCGGIIKPEVVLYEESLDSDVISNTVKYISSCDLLIVAGTSLTVYPASGFISYFRGKNLVIINKMTTNYDKMADLVIDDDIEKVFKSLK
ncbi:MAG: NAD-dependent protein deacylase [Bacilli bacterium]|nr:NAD-dependent protein deacylase [Bacilli bacterium]